MTVKEFCHRIASFDMRRNAIRTFDLRQCRWILRAVNEQRATIQPAIVARLESRARRLARQAKKEAAA
jgi:hypothetical protein